MKKEESFSTKKQEAAVQQETAASNTQDKAQDGKEISRSIVKIGHPFAPFAPVTKQELLSWIKNQNSHAFAIETWRQSSCHAPVPVRIQELLSWIPKSEKKSMPVLTPTHPALEKNHSCFGGR